MDEPRDEESAAIAWIRRNTSWLVLVFALVLIVLPRLSPFQPLNDYLNVFQRLSEWILGRIEHLFKDYGYYVVFFGVLLENSMFLGFLVPGTIILMLAGLSAENGTISLPIVIALGIVAALIGDTISYQVGRMGWTRLFERAGIGEMIEKVRGPMESNRRWIIIGYHFAGYSRAVGPAAAGIFRIPFRHWAPLDYAGAVAWVFVYVGIGVVVGLFGVQFGDTKKMARLVELLFLALLAAALGVTIWRALRREAPKDDPSPVLVDAADE